MAIASPDTYLKINSDLLTNQADEIRTLNGTTDSMTPSQMTTALQSANAEVAEQEQKIIEITEMLQNRALPEAAGGGASVKTCTVTVGGTLDPVTATVLDNGVIKSIATTSYTIENVVCGGTVVVFSQPAALTFSATGAKMIASRGGYREYHVFAIDPDATTVTISAEPNAPV